VSADVATGLTYSVALDGVTGRVVTVEADISNGVPGWSLSGLPDPCVVEARDRCRAAMLNSKQSWPDRRITVAMYPADVRKVGSHYDLPIALALLVANGAIPAERLRSTAVFGELSLDGRLRAVPGVLPAVLATYEAGLSRVIVPEPNAAEAGLVSALDIIGVRTLRECVALLRGETPPSEPDYAPLHVETAVAPRRTAFETMDLSDVKGQAQARWCVEVAAAGSHHLFLVGPPGAGKTMLAERLPALLPPLDLGQSIEVSKIHSVAGLLSRDEPLVEHPPFLAPNHTDTVPSVIGGGSRLIKPGAISLAHLGVLFLDEAPEFKPTVHDALRQPLESGEISIRRSDAAAKFPASFQLVLAANPCPCGSASRDSATCVCDPMKVRRYAQRISGPVRDRIDIHHRVPPVTTAEMYQDIEAAGSTAAVAARVLEARQRQRDRFAGMPWRTNAAVPGFEFRRRCPLSSEAAALVEHEVAHGRLTQRGADRVIRMAWTVADLAGRQRPDATCVQEALFLRTDGLCGESVHVPRAA
jgi:magnesium chelatase family protein